MSVNSFDDYPMSWKPTLTRSGRPIYAELAQQLERDIESGALLPGTKLPPQRELADFLNINLSTVSRAFKICADNGLLTGSVGDGTYVSYNSLTRLTDAPHEEMIRLDAMTPETLEQSELVSILRRCLPNPVMSGCSSTILRIPTGSARLHAGCCGVPGAMPARTGYSRRAAVKTL